MFQRALPVLYFKAIICMVYICKTKTPRHSQVHNIYSHSAITKKLTLTSLRTLYFHLYHIIKAPDSSIRTTISKYALTNYKNPNNSKFGSKITPPYRVVRLVLFCNITNYNISLRFPHYFVDSYNTILFVDSSCVYIYASVYRAYCENK